MPARPLACGLAGLAVLAAAGAAATAPAAAATTCPAPPPMTFEKPKYVDTTRAGGEPIVFTYPDGTLLYGSHAGSTHFYTPEAAAEGTLAYGEHYNGQTYYWYSTSNGAEWTYADRTLPPENVPFSGFSDPEFAYDDKGNVFVSEINLVNVAVSKSSDKGRSYQIQNATANIFTDRQWTEADTEDVVYLVSNPTGPGGTVSSSTIDEYKVNQGHTLYKSTDGGKTWTPGIKDPGGFGDIRVDKRNGTVYEAHMADGALAIAAYRDARSQTFTEQVDPEMNVVAEGVRMLSHWPAFDLDASGNLYVTWDESGKGTREAGVYYSYSTDAGKTWAKPIRVDTDDHTSIWPWIGVGDDGKVGIAWLEADLKLPDHDAQTKGTHGWRIVAAETLTGLGCGGGKAPSFTTGVMTPDPVHVGTICQGGTTCQAMAIDRRLGDYFSVDVDNTGMLYAGYSDTMRGGAVSLPAFVRQNGGAPLIGDAPVPRQPVRPAVPRPQRPARPSGGAGLPTTGADVALPAVAAMAAMAAYALRRRRVS